MRLEPGTSVAGQIAVRKYRMPSEQADHNEKTDRRMPLFAMEMGVVVGVLEATQGQVVRQGQARSRLEAVQREVAATMLVVRWENHLGVESLSLALRGLRLARYYQENHLCSCCQIA